MGGEGVRVLKLCFRNVALVQRNVELALDFGARPLCVTEESNELGIATAVKTLRDVVHDGSGRSANLVLQSIVRRKFGFLRQRVYLIRELPSQLPGFDIFETSNRHTITLCWMLRSKYLVEKAVRGAKYRALYG